MKEENLIIKNYLQDLLVGDFMPADKFKDYLKKLSEALIPEKAIEIALNYSIRNLIDAEGYLESLREKFPFKGIASDFTTKIDQAIQVIKWKSVDFKYSMPNASYIENIALDWNTHSMMMKKILESEDKSILDYHFFRDVLTSVPRNLSERGYSIKATKENMDTGHLLRECNNSELKVISGLDTEELIDFLISKGFSHERRVKDSAIREGFEDPWTAIIVATKVRDYSDASLYVDFGFTKRKDVEEIEFKHLKIIHDRFGGSFDNEDYTVHKWVSGDRKKLSQALKVATMEGAMDCYDELGKNIPLMEKYLELPEEGRPSAEAFEFVRERFKVKEFDKMIPLAKEIDSPILGAYWDEEFFGKIESVNNKKDVLSCIESFNVQSKAFKSWTGKDLSPHDFVKLVKYEGEGRFLKYFPNDFEKAEKVNALIPYVDFEEIIEKNEISPDLLAALLLKGCKQHNINSAFISKKLIVEDYLLLQYLEKLKDILELAEIIEVANLKIDPGVHVYMKILKSGYFGFGSFKIPFGFIKTLDYHEVGLEDFAGFYVLARKNSKRYWSDGFDANLFLEDLLKFCNKLPVEENKE